jgi:hypothetical protein
MTDSRDILSVALNHREISVPTDTEDLRYIQANYRGRYVIIRPGRDGGPWKAQISGRCASDLR